MPKVDRGTVLVANPGADLFGSDRMMLETVRGLTNAGFKVIASVPEEGPLVEELRRAGGKVVLQPTPILRKGVMNPRGLLGLARQTLTAIPGIWRLIRSSGAGTVLVNTITSPLWLCLGRIAPGVRVACHVHEAEQALSPLVRRLLYLPLYAAHRVIANSRHTLDVLSHASPRLAGRTVVVHNTVPGPDRVEPARPFLAEPIRLLYVGRISQRKGLLVAVEALATLLGRGVEARLKVVGSVFAGNEGFLDQLRARIDALALTGHVEFAGFRAVIWPDLGSADVLLVPSLQDESFGNVAVEAALAARPAVVSALSGLREATENSGAVELVKAGDPVAIADAVERLAGDWPAAVTLAARSAPAVAEAYSLSRYTAGIVSALALVPKAAAVN